MGHSPNPVFMMVALAMTVTAAILMRRFAQQRKSQFEPARAIAR